jgi:hypothetical protein
MNESLLMLKNTSQNRMSHCLANLARIEGTSHVWLGSRPEVLAQVLDQDLLVNPYHII